MVNYVIYCRVMPYIGEADADQLEHEDLCYYDALPGTHLYSTTHKLLDC